MSIEITETKNRKYNIEPIHMNNDSIIKGFLPPLPQNNKFFMIVCGQPGSGKTYFFLNLINKQSKLTLYKKFGRVYIFSNSLHTICEKIKLPEDRLFNGISELEGVENELRNENERALIILDDVISDIKDYEFFLKLLSNRRHIGRGISIVILTQVWNKLPLPLRKVATHLVLFNTSNKREFQSIYDDFISIKREAFDKILKYTFDKIHSFLFFDTVKKQFFKNFNLLSFEE